MKDILHDILNLDEVLTATRANSESHNPHFAALSWGAAGEGVEHERFALTQDTRQFASIFRGRVRLPEGVAVLPDDPDVSDFNLAPTPIDD